MSSSRPALVCVAVTSGRDARRAPLLTLARPYLRSASLAVRWRGAAHRRSHRRRGQCRLGANHGRGASRAPLRGLGAGEAPAEPTRGAAQVGPPEAGGARVFNSLPNLMHLDDKAVLAAVARLHATRPLATHVLYGEWTTSDRRAAAALGEDRAALVDRQGRALVERFSAALLDRRARPLRKKDVRRLLLRRPGVRDAPLLLDGRKFELRQYVLLRGDGSAFTYERALMRFASVEYDLHSSDRRAHITNKWVQTGWEAANELCGLDEIERVSTRWPAYEALLTERITPLLCDLVDAVGPLLRSGLRAVPRGERPPL